MSTKCILKMIFIFIILIIIVNGYAKDISGVEIGQQRLNEYISHYETLNYDHEHVSASHNRAKRSVTKDHYVHLKFSAHGRDFHLRLKRDLNTFSDKLEFYDSNGPIDVPTDHIYEGEVIGDRNSYVFGSILNGVFEGKIITERDAYYVEHAKRYFSKSSTTANRTQPQALRHTADAASTLTAGTNSPAAEAPMTKSNTNKRHNMNDDDDVHDNDNNGAAHNDNNEFDFHSIIYKDSHVEDAYRDMREGHVGGCGITEEVSLWMENIQNSAVEELPTPMSKDVLRTGGAINERRKEKLHKQRRTAVIDDKAADDDVDRIVVMQTAALNGDVDKHVAEHSSSANNETPTTAHNSKHKKSNATTPPKKYSNNNSSSNNNSHKNNNNNHNHKNNHSNNNNNKNGANDDFKYPYQKYTKEANFRFDTVASTDNGRGSGGGGGNSFYGTTAQHSGNFYDPETGRKYAPTDDDWHERVHERVRRASGSSSPSGRREDNKNTCSLYIQTDPLIWRHIREGIADHDRGRKYEIDVKTREEITSLIAHHVTAVNYIYRNTKFDGRTEHRNIRFEVQRIKIDDDSACRNSYNGPHNAFCNEHMDVSNFLNLHSLEDHSDFCLAYVFTYRDFTGGTLGLAWVASASGASGGICEKFKTYTETVGGQYQSTKRSLNTGIITFVNYNSRVPPKVSQLTLAHEIGHNFGSPHDYPQECRPGGQNGNYIMFASATSGDRPNNSKFSPCSIRNISNVLDVLVGNQKRDCFKASEGAFCGNKIVELGEECDCGFNEDECKDKCCYPRLISEYDMSLNSSAKGCTRRAKTQCSPSQGPCCLANSCTFVPVIYNQKCKEETECSWSSTCNGTTAECPDPKPRDDKTKCNNGTALCIRGECSGSICLLWNMTECFLTSQIVPNVDKRKLCELACQNGNDTTTCRSTSEFAHIYGLPVGGISLRPGSPCDNFQGYCDVFLKCRAVDADGPLVRLKNLLLNRETLLTLAQWVTDNWYIVVLMGIGFIIVMGIFIKCCAVHTPSSNPKKRRARRISETLRAPMNTLRRMRHPHGRSAGPRSIPPPAHEARHGAHHSRQHHAGDWDRRAGGHSVVPLPTGGAPHHGNRGSSRPSGGSSSHAARSARSSHSQAASGGRPVSGTRSAQTHGYAEHAAAPLPAAGAIVSGSVSGGGLVSAGGSGAGLVSRQQMPLPLPPIAQSQQQQQQQQQHNILPQPHAQQQAYYAPKVVDPQQVSYSRPILMHNATTATTSELYADAYAALGRGAYEAVARVPNNNKV